MSAINIDRAIAVGRLALTAIEILEVAVKTAATALAAGRQQLGTALGEMEEMRGEVRSDRAKMDSKADEKFK